MTDLVAGCERIDIADHLMTLSHIVAQDVDEVLVDASAFGKLHDRDEDTFLVDFVRIRAEAATADIHHMGGTGEVADEDAVAKARRDDGEVVQVAGALPGVVGDVDVTLEDILRADARMKWPTASAMA